MNRLSFIRCSTGSIQLKKSANSGFLLWDDTIKGFNCRISLPSIIPTGRVYLHPVIVHINMSLAPHLHAVTMDDSVCNRFRYCAFRIVRRFFTAALFLLHFIRELFYTYHLRYCQPFLSIAPYFTHNLIPRHIDI